ncbi:MAG: DUF934 domain-containing protein [Alphaproteobacteria bacterium]|nr:DUF934 domain-containing protein [Alphaproteobacteria bacterium]
MPLLKNDQLVEDTFVRLGTDDPLPATGDVFVPFARLLKDWEKLSGHTGRIGVALGNVDRAEALSLFLARLDVITLPFPAFNDGRAYSLARQIRELGYGGELRATGNVLPDQLQLMLQVGFDAFEIGDRFPLSTWQAASRQMSLAYQRGLYRRNAETDVWSERHTDADPWLEQPHAG